jgi:hypothetical protein
MPMPGVSMLLAALMAWPNDEVARNSWMATNAALFVDRDNQIAGGSVIGSREDPNKVAFEAFGGLGVVARAALAHLGDQLDKIQPHWAKVADVLQIIIDIGYEKRIPIPGGASVSKAVEMLEIEKAVPAQSRLRANWSRFRDVAHLITAAAYIAREGAERAPDQIALATLTPVLLAPEAMLALALGFQAFGLIFKPFRQKASLLPAETLWRIPTMTGPEKLFLPVRRLTDDQLTFLAARRARR